MTSRPRDRLPTEVSTPATRGRVLVVIAVTLLGVLLINYLAGLALDKRTTNRGYWLVRSKWDLLESMPKPVDWLILGDSSCNQGIKPDIVAAELGGTAVNLCTVGDMLAVNDAWMLARHIERLGPPKHVVIAHVYDMWARDQRALVRQPLLAKIPLEWGYWRAQEPALTLTPEDERQLWIARHVPLWAENKTLTSWLRHPGLLSQPPLEMTPEGFMAYEKANPGNVRREGQSHIASARKRRFAMSKINRQALEQIRSLADQHGFDVYIAAGPLYDGIWKDEGFKGHFNAMMKALDGIASKSPRMHVVLHEPVTFGVKQMENADHLVGPAADEFTKKLVAAIAAESAAPGTSSAPAPSSAPASPTAAPDTAATPDAPASRPTSPIPGTLPGPAPRTPPGAATIPPASPAPRAPASPETPP